MKTKLVEVEVYKPLPEELTAPCPLPNLPASQLTNADLEQYTYAMTKAAKDCASQVENIRQLMPRQPAAPPVIEL